MRALILFLLLLLPLLAHSATLHVSPEGSGTNGLTWQTAYPSITEAVDAASPGDSIWVKAGVYEEAVEVTKEISLYGGFAGTENPSELDLRDIGLNETIIDAFELNKNGVLIENASSVIVDGFHIIGNSSDGGGIGISHATATIRNCVIRDSVGDFGAGIFFGSSGGVVENCRIYRNRGFKVGGGIMATEGSHPIFINCIVWNNEGRDASGIGVFNGSTARFLNCLTLENFGNALGGVFVGSSTAQFVNSMLRENGDKEIHVSSGGGEVKVSYSNIQGGWPGEGNIDADPLFMDPATGDFRLQENSPCIDSASTMGPITDIDGNVRPVDIPGVGRDGTGDEFDMGPYERSTGDQPTFTPTFTPTHTATGTNTPTPTATPTPKLMYVSDDAASGGDGTTWENAFRSIDDALDISVDGDSVWVESGTYSECVKIQQAITLLGGFDGTETSSSDRQPDRNVCRLEPCMPGQPSLNVERFPPRPLPYFKVDGFILTGSPRETHPARAVLVKNATGVLENVTVTEGHGKESGGGLRAERATLLIRDSTFTGNDVITGGGGMYFDRSKVDLIHCSISDNTAAYRYGDGETKGLQTPYWGGGILGEESVVRATDCLIERNDARSAGGVCIFKASSELRLVSCSISNNSATNAAAMIASTLEPVSLTNCLVVRNDSRMENPGLWLDGQGEPVLIQYCTIADNSTVGPGGGIHSMDFKEIHVENSVVWGNDPEQISGELTLTEVTNSIVEGGYPGVDNLEADPLFEDSLLENYRLTRDSPAIDSAFTSGPTFDFDGNPRPIDSIGLGREGENAFDMGAYEYQDLPTATPTITPTPSHTPTITPTFGTDINLDGTVNAEDLLILLEDWGRVSGVTP